MKLLIDNGNSRVKWAFGAQGTFLAHGEAERDTAGSLQGLLAANYSPEEIRIANVAGAEAGKLLAGLLAERFGVTPVFARSAARGGGVQNGYTDPAQLGVDRWLAICAANARFGSPLCVVDAGTATTVDVLAAGGDHQGGLILPGIDLMQSALLQKTGDLARLAGSMATLPTPAFSPGRDTREAIHSGALQATAALIQVWLERLGAGPAAVESSPLLVLTGGAATPLIGALRALAVHRPAFRVELRPQLVLEGLALDPPCFQVWA